MTTNLTLYSFACQTENHCFRLDFWSGNAIHFLWIPADELAKQSDHFNCFLLENNLKGCPGGSHRIEYSRMEEMLVLLQHCFPAALCDVLPLMEATFNVVSKLAVILSMPAVIDECVNMIKEKFDPRTMTDMNTTMAILMQCDHWNSRPSGILALLIGRAAAVGCSGLYHHMKDENDALNGRMSRFLMYHAAVHRKSAEMIDNATRSTNFIVDIDPDTVPI